MKKEYFEIALLAPSSKPLTEKVKGYTTSRFGIHADEEKTCVVSHLETGAQIADFSLLRYAKHFALQCESKKFLMNTSASYYRAPLCLTPLNKEEGEKDHTQLLSMINNTYQHFAQ